MEKVLMVVDETRGSKSVMSVFNNLVRPPEEIVLLYVQRLEGRSLMIDMLGDAEMSTLKDMLKDTEHKENLDRRAETVLSFYKRELQTVGLVNIKTLIRSGNPVDEVVKVADSENAGLIIVGCNGKSWVNKLFTGCVARDVERSARTPVLVAKEKGCAKPSPIGRCEPVHVAS